MEKIKSLYSKYILFFLFGVSSTGHSVDARDFNCAAYTPPSNFQVSCDVSKYNTVEYTCALAQRADLMSAHLNKALEYSNWNTRPKCFHRIMWKIGVMLEDLPQTKDQWINQIYDSFYSSRTSNLGTFILNNGTQTHLGTTFHIFNRVDDPAELNGLMRKIFTLERVQAFINEMNSNDSFVDSDVGLWKAKEIGGGSRSIHATWDALRIINLAYKLYGRSSFDVWAGQVGTNHRAGNATKGCSALSKLTKNMFIRMDGKSRALCGDVGPINDGEIKCLERFPGDGSNDQDEPEDYPIRTFMDMNMDSTYPDGRPYQTKFYGANFGVQEMVNICRELVPGLTFYKQKNMEFPIAPPSTSVSYQACEDKIKADLDVVFNNQMHTLEQTLFNNRVNQGLSQEKACEIVFSHYANVKYRVGQELASICSNGGHGNIAWEVQNTQSKLNNGETLEYALLNLNWYRFNQQYCVQ